MIIWILTLLQIYISLKMTMQKNYSGRRQPSNYNPLIVAGIAYVVWLTGPKFLLIVACLIAIISEQLATIIADHSV